MIKTNNYMRYSVEDYFIWDTLHYKIEKKDYLCYRPFLCHFLLVLLDLCQRFTFASFHWSGKIPVSSMVSNIIFSGIHKCGQQSFTIFIDMRSGPCAFFVFSLVIISLISFTLTTNVPILLFIRKCNSGNLLLFKRGTHCDEK